jgi:hypothetical protein
MVVQEDGKDAEQDDEQNDDQHDEAVAGDALFVAQRAQAAHAAGGKIGDEARIAASGRLNCRRRRLRSAGKSYLRAPSSLNWSGVAVSSSARSGLTSSNTGSWTGFGGGAGSCVREMVAPCGIVVDRNRGVVVCWICVSSFLISDSSAAI